MGSGEKAPVEFPATSSVLKAAAFLIGNECKQVSDMYMLCKSKSADPVACIEQGEAVHECVGTLFERIKSSPCREGFVRYWKCLDLNNQEYMYCRDEEQAFHQCVKSHLGLEKRLWKRQGPEGGYKEPGDLPALNVWQYNYHVWKNKVS